MNKLSFTFKSNDLNDADLKRFKSERRSSAGGYTVSYATHCAAAAKLQEKAHAMHANTARPLAECMNAVAADPANAELLELSVRPWDTDRHADVVIG